MRAGRVNSVFFSARRLREPPFFTKMCIRDSCGGVGDDALHHVAYHGQRHADRADDLGIFRDAVIHICLLYTSRARKLLQACLLLFPARKTLLKQRAGRIKLCLFILCLLYTSRCV